MTTYITDANGTRWALVPVEPTPDMQEAADQVPPAFSIDEFPDIYGAMIDAAPPFPADWLVEKVSDAICAARNKWSEYDLEFDVPDPDEYVARAVIAAVFKDGE